MYFFFSIYLLLTSIHQWAEILWRAIYVTSNGSSTPSIQYVTFTVKVRMLYNTNKEKKNTYRLSHCYSFIMHWKLSTLLLSVFNSIPIHFVSYQTRLYVYRTRYIYSDFSILFKMWHALRKMRVYESIKPYCAHQYRISTCIFMCKSKRCRLYSSLLFDIRNEIEWNVKR